MRAAVESTGATGFGAFAGLHPLGDGRFLAASTDGVGTKLVLARERGALRACGADLAAHCINDVITTGAEPLILLDYVAANRIELDQVAELVEGAAEVCREAGVALVGGETAELPGIYRDEELDFAGTCVGIVAEARCVDGSQVEEGDAILGLPSAGVHANGFTLARRVLELEDYDGPDLLAPTRLYLDAVRRLRPRARAFAHVTGGGIEGNVRRVVPEGLAPAIDWDAWERPPVFEWLARARRRGRAAARVQPRDRLLRDRRRARAGRARDRAGGARVIGVLVSGRGTNLQALLDAGLPGHGASPRTAPTQPRSNAPSGRDPERRLRARRPPRPARARRRDGRLARGARRRPGRARGLHAPAHAGVPRPLPGADRERAPVAAAGRSRARTRSRTSSPPARPRAAPPSISSMPGSTPAACSRRSGCRSSRATRRRRCTHASRRSSTGCCRRVVSELCLARS